MELLATRMDPYIVTGCYGTLVLWAAEKVLACGASLSLISGDLRLGDRKTPRFIQVLIELELNLFRIKSKFCPWTWTLERQQKGGRMSVSLL